MAESGLSIDRPALLRYIGRHLGWSRTPGDWSANQQTDGNDIVDRGVAQFYNPPLLPGDPISHRWSFLKPTAYMTTVPDQGDYELPEDFGGMDGDLFYADDTAGIGEIHKTSDQEIMRRREGGLETTAYPIRYAISTIPADGSQPQRYMLMLEPVPSVVVELRYTYRSNPVQITSSKPYPLGGQYAADALVASCIAAADAMLNDEPMGANYVLFMDKLRSAVSHDRQEFYPRNLGPNDDPGRQPRSWDRALHATYNGVLYEGD